MRPAEPGGFQRSARFFGERPGVRAAGGDDERLFPVFRGQRPDLAAHTGAGMDADGVVEVAMHGNPLLTSVRSRPG